MKKLVHMWRYPRMVSWFIASTLLFLAIRLPFAKAQIIPYYLEFQPGIFLVPLAGVFWGPAGALGVTVASLLGDWLLGLWGVLAVYRAIGLFLFAYSAKQLWDFSTTHVGKRGGLSPHWGQTIRFLYVSLPGCFLAASWPAFGADLFRFYPFPYVAALLLLNNLLFTTLLGPVLYRILARELVPFFGCWRQVMNRGAEPVMSRRGALLHVTGCLGASLAGLLIGGYHYQAWPTQSFVLGSSTGAWVFFGVAPFLVLQVVGLFMRSDRPRATEDEPAYVCPGYPRRRGKPQ